MNIGVHVFLQQETLARKVLHCQPGQRFLVGWLMGTMSRLADGICGLALCPLLGLRVGGAGVCGQINLGLASVGMLAFSLPCGRTCGSRISFFFFFLRFSVLSYENVDTCKGISYPFKCFFSHFCVPPGCCNLSPGFLIFHKGIFIHGWLLNLCFLRGIRAGTSYSTILHHSIILFLKDCSENL